MRAFGWLIISLEILRESTRTIGKEFDGNEWRQPLKFVERTANWQRKHSTTVVKLEKQQPRERRQKNSEHADRYTAKCVERVRRHWTIQRVLVEGVRLSLIFNSVECFKYSKINEYLKYSKMFNFFLKILGFNYNPVFFT